MDFIKYILPCMFIFTGCGQQPQPVNKLDNENIQSYQSPLGFQIGFPSTLQYKLTPNDGSVVFATSKKTGFERRSNDYFLKIIEKGKSDKCMHMGIENPRIRKQGNNMIYDGKVIFKPNPDPLPEEQQGIFCAPSNFEKIVYALCSEKENRKAVICVYQRNDTLKVANQIFDTFQWLEN